MLSPICKSHFIRRNRHRQPNDSHSGSRNRRGRLLHLPTTNLLHPVDSSSTTTSSSTPPHSSGHHPPSNALVVDPEMLAIQCIRVTVDESTAFPPPSLSIDALVADLEMAITRWSGFVVVDSTTIRQSSPSIQCPRRPLKVAEIPRHSDRERSIRCTRSLCRRIPRHSDREHAPPDALGLVDATLR